MFLIERRKLSRVKTCLINTNQCGGNPKRRISASHASGNPGRREDAFGLDAGGPWTPLEGAPEPADGFLRQRVPPEYSGMMFRLREIE